MKGLKGGRAAGCSTGSFDTLKSLYFNGGEGTLIQLFDKVLNGEMHDASRHAVPLRGAADRAAQAQR